MKIKQLIQNLNTIKKHMGNIDVCILGKNNKIYYSDIAIVFSSVRLGMVIIEPKKKRNE